MSTNTCSRNGCYKTRCNRYAVEHGYICEECFNELCTLGPERINIDDFMRSAKNPTHKDASIKYYDSIFAIR